MGHFKSKEELLADYAEATQDQAEKEKLLNKLTPVQRLADVLHEEYCDSNHTDGCGWYYDNWSSYSELSRREWINMAEKMLATLDGDIELAIKIAKLVHPYSY